MDKEIYKTPNSMMDTTERSGGLFVCINYIVLVIGALIFLLYVLSFNATRGLLFYQLQNMVFPLILILSCIGTIKSLKVGWHRAWSVIGIFASSFNILVSAVFSFYGLFMRDVDVQSADFWMIVILLVILLMSITNIILICRQKGITRT